MKPFPFCAFLSSLPLTFPPRDDTQTKIFIRKKSKMVGWRMALCSFVSGELNELLAEATPIIQFLNI